MTLLTEVAHSNPVQRILGFKSQIALIALIKAKLFQTLNFMTVESKE